MKKGMKRRDFIESGGKITLAAGALTLTVGPALNSEPIDSNFIHHVFFWMKEPENKLHIERFQKGLRDLVTIEAIKSHHLGIPAETRREVIDSSYQYSLLTIFQDKKAHDLYQVHPVHDSFRIIVNELCSKVLVYDSVIF